MTNPADEFLGARARAALVVLALLLATVAWFRVQTTPAPIYASDEYAYLKRAQVVAGDGAGGGRDPYLQPVDNRLYFKLLAAARQWSGEPTPVVRALNFLGFYGLLGAGGYWLLRRRSSSSAAIYVVLLSVQAFSVYVLSLMPDVTYAVFFTLGAWLLLTTWESRPKSGVAAAAAVFASLLFVKPHAIAIVIAFVLFVAIDSWIRRAGWFETALRVVIAIATVALTVAALNAWLFHDLSLKPHFIGAIYAKAAAGNLNFWLRPDRIAEGARIFGAHVVALLILFPLLLVAGAHLVRKLLRRDRAYSLEDTRWLFALLCFLVVAAMVVKFSVEVGAENAAEHGRLHGRYVAFLFPLFAWIVAAQGNPETLVGGQRWPLYAYVGAVAGFIALLFGFRMYPWDYADLFVFFSATNPYWPFPQLEALRGVALVLAVILLLAALLRRLRVSAALVALGGVVSLVSLVRVVYWQENHARENKPLAESGRALKALFPKSDERLMLIGTERFGRMSYVLYGYDGLPWVRQTSADARGLDHPHGVDLVAAVGEVQPGFPPAAVARVGTVTAYGRHRSAPGLYIEPARVLPKSASLVATFGSPAPNMMTSGFNESEPWGAWTRTPAARLVLNQKLVGRVKVEGTAWVAAVSEPAFSIRIGASTFKIPAAVTPQPFAFECDLPEPVEEVEFLYPVYRDLPWARPLGVALTRIQFTAH